MLRAVFTGMKKKNLLPNYLSYKQIFREAIKEIKMTDKYIDFIADTVNCLKHLDCYEKKKIYDSDTADLIIAALTDIYSVTTIEYYSTNSDVQSDIFQPPNETSKTCLELSFVKGHFDHAEAIQGILCQLSQHQNVEVLIQ